VFVGYNSGTSTFTFNIAGMNTISSSSYYYSILRIFSNVYRTYQNNVRFYFESLIEYTSDINLSDVQTEISKLSNGILIIQNDLGEIERIVRLEDKTQNIGRNEDTSTISNTLNVSHVTGLKADDVVYQKIISIVLGGDNGINRNSGM
jgi:hypothetical protein